MENRTCRKTQWSDTDALSIPGIVCPCGNEELNGQPDRRDKLSTAAYRLPWKVKPVNAWMRFTLYCGLLAAAVMVTKKKVRHKVTTYTLTEYGINVLFNDSWYYDA